MAGGNFNFGQGSWPDEKSNSNTPLGTGEGESPMTAPSAPKIPDVDVRTYSSDVKSMAESGGAAPKPYAPAVSAPVAPEPVVPSQQPEEKKSFNEVFQAPGSVTPMPADVPPAGLQEFSAGSKSKKGLFALILGIIIVVGLGAIGYFYVYPTFFGGVAEIETPVVPPVEETTPVTPPIVPQVPVVETTSTEPVATSTEEEAPVPDVQILEHKSLLKTAADVNTNITLDALNLNSIVSQIDFSTAQVPILKEIVFKNSEGAILTAGDIMGTFLPDVFLAAASSKPLFESDFTFLTYTNDKGTWLTAVLKLFGDTPLTEVKAAVEKIESSANLKNLFLTDPGAAG
ncbi:MAG TPA: hypothetical protein VNK70_01370, partial [Candidatus Paceibacterota bacterium]|nr:hypothetical protein [Candidatus Paceibacterota bacterium]